MVNCTMPIENKIYLILSPHKQSRSVVGKLSPAIVFKVFDCQIQPILERASEK